jgi:hypothetical protein
MKSCLLVSSTFFYFPPPFFPLSFPSFVTNDLFPHLRNLLYLPFPYLFLFYILPSSFVVPTSSPCQTVLHVIITSSLHPSLPIPSPVFTRNPLLFLFTATSLCQLHQPLFTPSLTILPVSRILPPNPYLP